MWHMAKCAETNNGCTNSVWPRMADCRKGFRNCMMTLPAAPADILKTVICSCQKSACAAISRCSSRKASLPCTPSCRCHQCENTDVGGEIVTEEDSEGDDWVGLYHSAILQKVDVLPFAMLLVKPPFNMLTWCLYHKQISRNFCWEYRLEKAKWTWRTEISEMSINNLPDLLIWCKRKRRKRTWKIKCVADGLLNIYFLPKANS